MDDRDIDPGEEAFLQLCAAIDEGTPAAVRVAIEAGGLGALAGSDKAAQVLRARLRQRGDPVITELVRASGGLGGGPGGAPARPEGGGLGEDLLGCSLFLWGLVFGAELAVLMGLEGLGLVPWRGSDLAFGVVVVSSVPLTILAYRGLVAVLGAGRG